MVRVSKQQRKYKNPPEETEVKVSRVMIYKVLINGANFLRKFYDTQEEAEQAGMSFCKGSNSTYVVVGSFK